MFSPHPGFQYSLEDGSYHWAASLDNLPFAYTAAQAGQYLFFVAYKVKCLLFLNLKSKAKEIFVEVGLIKELRPCICI